MTDTLLYGVRYEDCDWFMAKFLDLEDAKKYFNEMVKQEEESMYPSKMLLMVIETTTKVLEAS